MTILNPSSDENVFSTEVSEIASTIKQPVLKVIGLGGGGSNAVNRMIEFGLTGVDFIAANTDKQALHNSLAPVKIQLGPNCTRGLGAGGNPSVGRTAAEESWRQIAAALHGADMVFLTAGMGGGTGTGSIAVASKIARSLGAVTISIVTTPFSFEMGRRQKNSQEGLARLQQSSDTLIAIPNDRLLYVAPRHLSMDLAFRMADDVLRQAVQGISELITSPGMINVDFANVRHLMKLGGGALMSIGQGEGDNKALKAIEKALRHPLLESSSLANAAGILVNFTSGNNLTLYEIETALTFLQDESGGKAEIVMGLNFDERFEDKTEVILVITGLGATPVEESIPGFKTQPTQPNNVELNPEQPLSHDEAAQPDRRSIKPEMEPISSGFATDLDVPAFLRRGK